MLLVVIFLMGFYLGLIAFSLLAIARRNVRTNDQSLMKFSDIYRFRETGRMIRRGRTHPANRDFSKAGDIL